MIVRCVINEEGREFDVRSNETLIDALRNRLGLLGAVEACGVGVCGSCTVLVSGRPVSSCIFLAANAEGESVQTVEGLSCGKNLDPIQDAFISHQAFQCGFCTSGMLMAAKALLTSNPTPTRAEISEYLQGNLCRCGTYEEVIAAITTVAEKTMPQPR
jgi:carbon-monoxide dehydrogenase small subunit